MHKAVRDALRLGAVSYDAVKHLVLCRIEGRPPRLEMELYPYLPRANVAKTSSRDYMTLLSTRGAAPPESSRPSSLLPGMDLARVDFKPAGQLCNGVLAALSVGFTTAAALVHELIEARDERRLLTLALKTGSCASYVLASCPAPSFPSYFRSGTLS